MVTPRNKAHELNSNVQSDAVIEANTSLHTLVYLDVLGIWWNRKRITGLNHLFCKCDSMFTKEDENILNSLLIYIFYPWG